ncbi:MAG: telomerase inhibitor [Lichina confinis]|nr:MAG: telomerase inhibitor [Lichina confinis]
MGLSEPRKRHKLSHDPNNTHWSSCTSNFGHRILASQGWKPGTHLGARDAPHAGLHGAGSFSHVRVVPKEDTLGLGASAAGHGWGDGEGTGLDAFQSLLGRLNGRTEVELFRQQSARDDLRRSQYVERRLGTMRFVRGGLLVGDQIRKDQGGEETSADKRSFEKGLQAKPGCIEAQGLGNSTSTPSKAEQKKTEKLAKKKRKQTKLGKKPEHLTDAISQRSLPTNSSEYASAATDEPSSKAQPQPTRQVVEGDVNGGSSPWKKSPQDRQVKSRPNENSERKKERERQKEKKMMKKKKKGHKDKDPKERAKKSRRVEISDGERLEVDASGAKVATAVCPSSSDTASAIALRSMMSSDNSAPLPTRTAATAAGSRGSIRQRSIAQKRLAVSNQRALNEILMIKA